MKVLVDMNLSPSWVEFLSNEGFEAVHWIDEGDPRAHDRVLLEWSSRNEHVVFTNDLDFGAILAASGANSPSVIQVRAQDLSPARLGATVASALRQYEDLLTAGALIVIDESRQRLRALPIRQ